MIYAIAASILWGVSYYSFSLLTRNGAQYWVLGLSFIPMSLVGICMTYVTSDDKVFHYGETNSLWIFAYLGATLLANICVFFSFKKGNDPFLMTMIEMTYPVFILLFLFYFENRSLQWKDFFGFSMVLGGLYLVK